MKYKNSDTGLIQDVTWVYFLPEHNPLNPLSDPLNGAYVAAITVAQRRLKTYDPGNEFNEDFSGAFDSVFDI